MYEIVLYIWWDMLTLIFFFLFFLILGKLFSIWRIRFYPLWRNFLLLLLFILFILLLLLLLQIISLFVLSHVLLSYRLDIFLYWCWLSWLYPPWFQLFLLLIPNSMCFYAVFWENLLKQSSKLRVRFH